MDEKEWKSHYKAGLDSIHLPKMELNSGKAKQIDKQVITGKVKKLILKYWFSYGR